MKKFITFTHKGDFRATTEFFERCKRLGITDALETYAIQGVEALQFATPSDTGETRSKWYYEIENDGTTASIHWCNANVIDGVNVAVIIQYGHGTRNGAFVEGIDYVNPALQPIFEQIASNIWKEVTS